ncbi:MAG: hypothetical protein P4L53_04805 [Candidatus Obscuribacterales bacterium]|nr:hypothetical protein [Candidatus Obscuribacterales bacterium]
MSQPNIYVDIDHPASAPIQVQLGQTLVLIRQSIAGGKVLHQLDLPASHFMAQPIANHGMTPLPGQPAGTRTHIVAIGTAHQKGSGNILVQFAPPNPMCPPSALAFTVS